ncbi:hypothetical protein [Tessaracoccus oleiagri]|uniref:KDO2-lipid IV(A) lauroyltransferase n=1 Tax=Tessaracoccus oleiagri TaxID=686624 RepID=A0A1G9MIZ1_9ACTN|nr:hypothetical protein [Tessaracoccus oleiagri]SDL74238.1 KDO2-lipid IV(A) lauroyltransferase [Tessaracoccus oleiagri]
MSVPERIFALGGRLPVAAADAFAGAVAPLAGSLPIRPLQQWRDNVERVTGTRPGAALTRLVVERWMRNNLWSMSLGRWSDAQVLARASVSDEEVDRLRTSLAGNGLVLALPHMGSWDFAGAWCARVGIQVVSVAERLPRGLFERFRDARAAMGMTIYATDEPDLFRKLSDDVAAGRLVCLLADRDLSRRGVEVTWPSGLRSTMPPGPALLARRTGADLRVTTTHFGRRDVRIAVSETIPVDGGAAATTQRLADRFAAAIAADPANWLVLQPLVR